MTITEHIRDLFNGITDTLKEYLNQDNYADANFFYDGYKIKFNIFSFKQIYNNISWTKWDFNVDFVEEFLIMIEEKLLKFIKEKDEESYQKLKCLLSKSCFELMKLRGATLKKWDKELEVVNNEI